MSHISAQFLGKNYNLACDEGQEEDLERLAKELSERLSEMESRFQQQGHKLPEAMLWVMTSLTLLDEIHDLRRDTLYWQQTAINTPPAPMPESERKREIEQALAVTLNDIAERLEKLAG